MSLIINTFQLDVKSSYDRIRDMETTIHYIAKRGYRDLNLEYEMKKETENYLRLTSRVLRCDYSIKDISKNYYKPINNK